MPVSGISSWESMATAQKNFRRLMRWLKNRDDIEITTFEDLMTLYSHQKDFMTRQEIEAMAKDTVTRSAILPGEDFSPAEAFLGIVESLLAYQAKHSLPERLPIKIRPFGPPGMPESRPGTARVSRDLVFELAQQGLVL